MLMLLERRATVDVRDCSYKRTPLHVAMENGNLEAVRICSSIGRWSTRRKSINGRPCILRLGRGMSRL